MKTIAIIFLLVMSGVARADGYAKAEFGYISDEEGQATPTKSTVQHIDLGGGWRGSSGFTILGMYAMETRTSTTSGVTTISKRTSYGPGLGYMGSSQVTGYITGVYYLKSEYAMPSVTYIGTGYSVNLGLKVSLGGVFILAGANYEHFDYPKTNSAELTPPRKENHISPRIGLQFEF